MHCQGRALEVAGGALGGMPCVLLGKPSRQPSCWHWAWQGVWNAIAGLFSMEAGHPLVPVAGESHGALGSSLSPAGATVRLWIPLV